MQFHTRICLFDRVEETNFLYISPLDLDRTKFIAKTQGTFSLRSIGSGESQLASAPSDMAVHATVEDLCV